MAVPVEHNEHYAGTCPGCRQPVYVYDRLMIDNDDSTWHLGCWEQWVTCHCFQCGRRYNGRWARRLVSQFFSRMAERAFTFAGGLKLWQ